MTDHEHASPEQDVARLVSALIDDTICDDERRRLVELLRADPVARRQYLELVDLDSMLQWDAASASLPAMELPALSTSSHAETPLAPLAYRPARQLTLLRWSLAAALLLCATLAALLGVQTAASRAVADTTIRSSEGGPVAMITDLRKAVWAPGTTAPAVSKPLVPGWLKLRSGRASLDFLGGAKAALEGPAEFGVNAADRGVLRFGKLSVAVSRRNGAFHVSAPDFAVQARGAEFALAVDENGAAELHVFSGSATASLSLPGGEPRSIDVDKGQAVAISAGKDEGYRRIAADPARFASLETKIGPPRGKVLAVDFIRQPVLPYGYQDGQFGLPSRHEALDGGHALHLSGNAWKMVEVNVDVMRDTVIEFEFRSPREGQIHGFGFDSDDTYSSTEPIFQIYGYEARRDIGQQFNDYAGDGWRLYRFPVGHYLTGPRRYLYFAADEDVTGEAESYFRNVQIYRAESR